MTANEKPKMEQEVYQSEIQAWHTDRLNKLRKPDGWLSVIGLYWLRAH